MPKWVNQSLKGAGIIFSLVGSVYLGILGLDARYVAAEEYQKDSVKVQRALTQIQVRQLQREAREIVQDSNGRLSKNDRERLDAIATEIAELKAQ